MDESKLSTAETQFRLPEYDLIDGLFADFEELGLLFAYSTLFVVSCPPVSFFSLVLNVVEIRVDAYKMLDLFRRPIATSDNSIGTWMTIYELLTVLAVLTNAGLLVYTIDVMPSYSPSDHVWAFITFQFVCYSSLYTAHLFIPDTPKDVIIQLQRGDILVERIIQNVPEKGRTSNDILAYNYLNNS